MPTTIDLTPHRQDDALCAMAEHKGACNAILQACRLLRAHGMRDAADLLIGNVETITQGEQ